MNLILIGFMGAGKSAVGKLAAERLGRAFYDTDVMIEKETGLSVSEIFARQGEDAFRNLETQAIRLVTCLPDAVIATGGGAPLREENRRAMEKSGIVVCLSARPETILKRLKDQGTSRPLLAGREPLDAVRSLLNVREKAYGHAKAVIPTDDLDAASVADAVVAAFQRLSGSGSGSATGAR